MLLANSKVSAIHTTLLQGHTQYIGTSHFWIVRFFSLEAKDAFSTIGERHEGFFPLLCPLFGTPIGGEGLVEEGVYWRGHRASIGEGVYWRGASIGGEHLGGEHLLEGSVYWRGASIGGGCLLEGASIGGGIYWRGHLLEGTSIGGDIYWRGHLLEGSVLEGAVYYCIWSILNHSSEPCTSSIQSLVHFPPPPPPPPPHTHTHTPQTGTNTSLVGLVPLDLYLIRKFGDERFCRDWDTFPE